MNQRIHGFALAASGVALGGGVIGYELSAKHAHIVMVIIGVTVAVLGLLAGTLALFASEPPSSEPAATVRELLATYRRYAHRSFGRFIFVVCECLILFSFAVRFVAAVLERRWAYAASCAGFVIGIVILVLIKGSDEQHLPAVAIGDSAAAQAPRPSMRLPTKDGWYQENGRWYCEAHNTRYCKVCSP